MLTSGLVAEGCRQVPGLVWITAQPSTSRLGGASQVRVAMDLLVSWPWLQGGSGLEPAGHLLKWLVSSSPRISLARLAALLEKSMMIQPPMSRKREGPVVMAKSGAGEQIPENRLPHEATHHHRQPGRALITVMATKRSAHPQQHEDRAPARDADLDFAGIKKRRVPRNTGNSP